MTREGDEKFLNTYSKVIFTGASRKEGLPPNYHKINCPDTRKILFTVTFLYSPLKTKNTLVFYHGNGEVVEDYLQGEFTQKILTKMNICFVEYRGYGFFSQVEVGVMDLFDDVAWVHEFLSKRQIVEENIIVMGRSIGSLFASHYSLLFPSIRGVVIESGFRSITDKFYQRYSRYIEKQSKWNDINEEIIKSEEEFTEICENYMDNGKKIRNYGGNILILHAEDDHLVVLQKGKDLYDAAKSSINKEIVIAKTGRHSIAAWSPQLYWDSLFSFIDRIFPPPSPSYVTKNITLVILILSFAVLVISCLIYYLFFLG